MMLSIIIPTYNYASYLKRALYSVITNLEPETELIIVDDGSTDGTEQLIENFTSEKNISLKYVRQHNKGAAAARNHGLKVATGEYVIFLDADDELLPGTISVACNYLKANPDIDMLLGGKITQGLDGKKTKRLPDALHKDPSIRVSDYLLHKNVHIGHGSFVVRKDLVARRPYPESLRKREDIAVFAFLLAHAHIGYVDHPMVLIHKHPGSLRRQHFQRDNDPIHLVNEVFALLPPACQVYRNAYAAKRYVSAFRGAFSARMWQDSWRFLNQFLKHDPRWAARLITLQKILSFARLGRR